MLALALCWAAPAAADQPIGGACTTGTADGVQSVDGNNVVCIGSVWQYPAYQHGNSTATCNGTAAGILRYTGGNLQYCNSSVWTTLSAVGTLPLSGLTGASATNTRDHANYAQTWTWNTLTTGTAMTLSSSSMTGGTLLSLQNTAAAATATGDVLSVTNASTGAGYGIYSSITGQGNTGYAGYFTNTSTTGANIGLYGATASTDGAAIGVEGYATSTTNGAGVAGYSNSTSGGNGVYGNCAGGNCAGVMGYSANSIGVHGKSAGTSSTSYGVYAEIIGAANTGYAGYFTNTATTANYGVYATTASTGAGYGVYGSITGSGSNGQGYGGYFLNSSTTGGGEGMHAESHGGNGVTGITYDAGYVGVYGSDSGGNGYGVFGAEFNAGNTGYAGYFTNTSTAGLVLYAQGQSYFDNGHSAIVTTYNIEGNDWAAFYDPGLAGANGGLALGGTGALLSAIPGTPTMFWNVNQNLVGIGTTSPQAPLDVYSTTANILALAGSNGAATRSIVVDTSGTDVNTNIGGAINFIDDGAYGANITFSEHTGGAGTAQTERMRINTNGNVGIGTTSPSYKLHVSGGTLGVDSGSGTDTLEIRDGTITKTSGSGFNFSSTVNVINGASSGPSYSFTSDGATGMYLPGVSQLGFGINGVGDAMRITSTGSVGIGTTSPTQTLDVNGKIHVATLAANSATTICRNANVLSSCSSSIRYKENVKAAPFGLQEVMEMRPVTFKWRGRDENDLGLIAEEMEKINPLFVTYERGQIEGVKYSQLTAVLVKAVQELKADNDMVAQEQQAEIEALRAEVAALKARGGKN